MPPKKKCSKSSSTSISGLEEKMMKKSLPKNQRKRLPKTLAKKPKTEAEALKMAGLHTKSYYHHGSGDMVWPNTERIAEVLKKFRKEEEKKLKKF
jgi:hypothetical protein